MMESSTTATMDRDALRALVSGTLAQLSRTGEVPVLPSRATAALALVRDPDADTDRLCRILRTDVGLVARILRAANSIVYGRRAPARTLQDAVLTLGLHKTCDLLVAAAARQMFRAAGPHARDLWHHALATALAAEELARRTRRADPATAFLPGLFHDVGRIAFLLADPASYDVIASLAAAEPDPAAALEREWYAFDHAEAGASLAAEWGLVPESCEAIRWHHRPADATEDGGLALLVRAADELAYRVGLGGGPRPPAPMGLAALGLTEDEQAACARDVERAFAAHRDLLG
jgi:putative nucleotidyltransferase with HDIG domain